jgi:ribonuclease
MKTSVSALVGLASLVAALPSPQTSPPTLEAGTVCGKHDYSTAQVKGATKAACQQLTAGTTAGSNKYPHGFRNEEGFDFDVAGPLFEFPILEGGIYKGGRCQ